MVPGMNETLYDTLAKQPRIHCLCHYQGHPEENKSMRNETWLLKTSVSSEVHEDKSGPACWINITQTWQHVHLCGMSFGTSISRDLIWRILMLPSIPLADTTSQANSYIVLDSSQAYTSAAPAFFAHMLNRKKKKIKTMIPNEK